MKIGSVGGELFRVGRWTDGRTDMTKLIVVSRNSVHAHTKDVIKHFSMSVSPIGPPWTPSSHSHHL